MMLGFLLQVALRAYTTSGNANEKESISFCAEEAFVAVSYTCRLCTARQRKKYSPVLSGLILIPPKHSCVEIAHYDATSAMEYK